MADKLFPSQYERIKQTAGVKTDLELAEVLGITSSGITNAKARGVIPRKWLLKVAGMYNVDVEWLKYGDGIIKQETRAGKREKQMKCSRCAALEAKLDIANERLYEAMQENGNLKEEVGKLKAELIALKNKQPDIDQQNDIPLANAS